MHKSRDAICYLSSADYCIDLFMTECIIVHQRSLLAMFNTVLQYIRLLNYQNSSESKQPGSKDEHVFGLLRFSYVSGLFGEGEVGEA